MRFDKHEMHVGIIYLFLQWLYLPALLLRPITAALVALLLKSMKFPLNQKNPSRNGRDEEGDSKASESPSRRLRLLSEVT